MKILPLALAAIVMPSCAIIVASSTFPLLSARSGLSETQVTEAYSCAYLAGQYAIMNRMPSVFSGGKQVPPSTCERFRIMAAKHGFSQD